MRLMLICASAAIAGILTLSAVHAQGGNALPVEVDCGTDGQFTAVAKGNGNWGAAHLDGGGVFIPTGFEDVTGSFTVNGDVFTFEDPDVQKPFPRNQEKLVCDFVIDVAEDGGMLHLEGTVIGFIPHHK